MIALSGFTKFFFLFPLFLRNELLGMISGLCTNPAIDGGFYYIDGCFSETDKVSGIIRWGEVCNGGILCLS